MRYLNGVLVVVDGGGLNENNTKLGTKNKCLFRMRKYIIAIYNCKTVDTINIIHSRETISYTFMIFLPTNLTAF